MRKEEKISNVRTYRYTPFGVELYALTVEGEMVRIYSENLCYTLTCKNKIVQRIVARLWVHLAIAIVDG